MRKLICSALMINCLVLSACSSTRQQVESFSQRLAAAQQLQMTVQVEADHGETLEAYTLDYIYDGDGWQATVLAPESLSGITAHMADDASQLEYDGVILAAGNILSNGVSAMGAVPLALQTLQEGSLDCVWKEGALVAGTYLYDDSIGMSLWYDGNGVPVAMELTEEGIGKVRCHTMRAEIEGVSYGTTDKTDLGGNQSGSS